MKQNDWIVANINNPSFSAQDFKDVGLDLDNTQILPMDSYLNSNFITENSAFKNDAGEFSKDKFSDFYKSKLASFETFKNDTDDTPEYEYDLFDTSRKPDSKVKDPQFKLELVSNPTRTTVGISERNKIGEKKFTVSELAQQSKIFDPTTGKYLDYSPNDMSLVKNPIGYIKTLFDEPLVIAQYEEDGEHIDPITKRVVKHTRGQYKLNEDGQYYTERLNGRSLIGKQVLSSLDTLTVDGEGINKYDFFDSDSLDKSVTGSIAKAAATVAPLFFGPYIAGAYSGILVGRELAKSLPMLSGMVGSLFGLTEDNRVVNSIAAVGQKFTGGTSEYSQQNTFTFENVANLLSDVATQFGQQRAIAKSLQTLRGGSKKAIEDAYLKANKEYIQRYNKMLSQIKQGELSDKTYQYMGNPSKWQESALGTALIQKYLPDAQKLVQKRARFGADAALAYMAIVSNTDVYSSMLEHGATKKEASAVALGSTLGMFGVDRYLHIGELFFDDLTQESEKAIRKVFIKEADSWKDSLIKITSNPEINTKNKLSKLINNGIQLGKNATNQFLDDLKYHTTGFIGKAVGEGLEEVSEEFVADLSKQIYELAGDLGFNTSTRNVGAWENALPRYGMSLFGGALGGAVFHGVDLVQGNKAQQNQQLDELIYLVRNGKTNELLSTLEEWRNKGKLGNTKLSATKSEKDSSGKDVYLTANSKSDSQNEYIYNRIKETILQLDALLNANNAKLDEEALFKQMVLSEAKFLALKDVLKDKSYSTGYQEYFQNILKDITITEKQLEENSKTIDGTAPVTNEDGSSNIMTDKQRRNLTQDQINFREKNLDRLRKKLEELTLQKDNFLAGKESMHYTRKMLFLMDPSLHSAFISMTFPEWVEANYPGKDIENLSQEEASTLKEEYLEYKKGEQKSNLTTQFQTFLNVEKEIAPTLLNIQENQENFKKYQDLVNKLFNDKNNPFSQTLITYDDRLEGESDEDYEFRDKRREDEDETLFQSRRALRAQQIDELNAAALQTMAEQVNAIIQESGGFIDPITLRRIKEHITGRKSDLVQNAIWDAINSSASILEADGFDNITQLEQEISNVIFKLKPDLSNLREISEEIKTLVQNPIREKLQRSNSLRTRFSNGIRNIINNSPLFTHLKETYKDQPITGNIINVLIEEYLKNNPAESKEDLDALFEITDENELFDTEYLDWANITPEETQSIINIFRNTFPENRGDLSYSPLTEEELEKQIDSLSEGLLEEFNNRLNTSVENIKNNPQIQLLVNLDNTVKQVNPIQDLIKSLGLKLDKNSKNLENVLQIVSRDFEEIKDAEDFRLTEDQKISFEEAAHLIQLAKAYITAASTTSSYDTPIGHNKTVNDFAESHRDVIEDFEPLATIDQDVASFYIQELDTYLDEIDYWIAISDNNQTNKKRKFIKAETNFNKARYDFFRINRNAFKFDLDGNSVDLLRGFEAVSAAGINDEDNILIINKVENLLYDNVQEVLKRGYSFFDILEKSQIIEKISNIEEVSKQLTTPLDEKVSYSTLTDYDKIVYLFTASAMKADDFNNFLKGIVEQETKIAPLTVQEYLSRIGIASIVGKDIVDSGLEYLKNKLPYRFPILNAVVFIDGVAGAGKTQAIAKTVSKYIDSDDIWLTAPKESQRKTLHESIQKGQEKSKEKIFEEILDPDTYAAIMKDINENKQDSKYYNTVKLLDGSMGVSLKKDSITFKDFAAPKLIIIDEVTHFSNIELQVLNEYASQHGIRILELGDTNQNGFNKIGFNIDRETCFTMRAPKLSISLRDVNIQKQSNLEKILDLLNQLRVLSNKEDDPFYEHKHKQIQNYIKNLNFKVFNQDTLNGDLITNIISPELVQKLKTSGASVGFVGNINAKSFKALKDAGIEPVVLEPTDVQGQEFDYIVVDKDWKYDEEKATPYQTFNFLQDLYTMISRGKNGSILIDNGLSKIIGPNKEEFHTALAPNLKEAVEEFRKIKLDILSKMSPEPSEEPVKTTEDETEDSGEDSGEPDSEEGKGLPEDEGLVDEAPETPEKEKEIQDKVEKELKDNKLEDGTDQKEIDSDSLLNKDLPIRVYGSAHLSGYAREKRTIDGKEVNILKRVSPDNRDLGIFTKAEEILDGEEKDALVTEMLDFKSVILYEHDWDSLSDSNKNRFSEQNLKDIEYKIEVRESQPSDNFVGYTGLAGEDGKTNEVRTINGLVYSLVATFKNKKGEDCTLTLGLLANPETWKKDVPNQQRNITDRINELKSQGEDTSALEDWRDKGLPNKVDAYTALMKQIAEKYTSQKEPKPLYFKVNPRFSGLTYLRYKDNMGNPITPQTLYINENTPEYKKGERGYLQTHPYLVTSDVYVYNETVPGVKDDSMKGKAVIFVSRDTTLSPSELPQMYVSQKEDAANHPEQTPFQRTFKPNVRMIKLNSRGVSFDSLASVNYAKIYKSSTGKDIEGNEEEVNLFPFELDYMGTRMFVSMWNFRANLKQFLEKVGDFMNTNGLDQNKLQKILDADYQIYLLSKDKGVSVTHLADEDINDLLKSLDVSREDYDKVITFNSELANKVRQFRLGGSNRGAMVRRLSNISSDNIFYKGIEKPVGIYVDLDTANQYYKLIDSIFTNVFDDVLKLTDPKTKESWPIDRLISPNAEKRNSVSGLINDIFANSATLSWEEDGKTFNIEFPAKKTFKLVPTLLVQLHKTVIRHILVEDDLFKTNATRKIDGQEKSFDFSPILSLIGKGYNEDIGRFVDPSFVDMFRLMFHGTLQNVHSTDFKATDAYFKEGLKTDAMTSSETISINGKMLFKKCITNMQLFEIDTEIDMPVFDVFLTNLEEAVKTTGSTKPVSKPLPKKAIVPEETVQEFKNILKNSIQEEDLVDELLEESSNAEDFYNTLLTEINDIASQNLSSKFGQNNINLDTVVSFELEEGKLNTKTIKDIIEEKIKQKIPENVLGNCSENEYSISLPNGQLVAIKFNNFNNSISIDMRNSGEANQDNIMEDVAKYINEEYKEALKDGLFADKDIKKLFTDTIINVLRNPNQTTLNDLRKSVNDFVDSQEDSLLDEEIDFLDKISEYLDNTKTNCKV